MSKTYPILFVANLTQLGQEPMLPGHKLGFLGNRESFPLPTTLINPLGKAV
uniref:Uncharacterized protein n=1 Tax=Anguilla anguilla TaxID=7936 RepID=A0A0E9XYW4_ANGAN